MSLECDSSSGDKPGGATGSAWYGGARARGSHRNGANTLVLPRPLSLLRGESLAYLHANEMSLGKVINAAKLTGTPTLE